MRKMSAIAVLVLCLLLLPALLLADTLVPRDGIRIPGLLVRRTSSTITFRNSRGIVRRYRASDVEDVEISSRRQNTSGSPDTYDRSNNNSDNSVSSNSNDHQPEVLRAGTQLEILTNETIDSS